MELHEHLQDIITPDSNEAEGFCEKGVLFSNQGEYEAALKNFDLGVRAARGNPVLRVNRAGTYLSLGKFEEAVQEAELGCQLAPTWYKAFLIKGKAHIRLKQHSQAVLSLSKAASLCPDDDSIQHLLSQAKMVTHNKIGSVSVSPRVVSPAYVYRENISPDVSSLGLHEKYRIILPPQSDNKQSVKEVAMKFVLLVLFMGLGLVSDVVVLSKSWVGASMGVLTLACRGKKWGRTGVLMFLGYGGFLALRKKAAAKIIHSAVRFLLLRKAAEDGNLHYSIVLPIHTIGCVVSAFQKDLFATSVLFFSLVYLCTTLPTRLPLLSPLKLSLRDWVWLLFISVLLAALYSRYTTQDFQVCSCQMVPDFKRKHPSWWVLVS
eukprot:TRINITY_DN1778_c1_g1_i1.p1 TRINITY_DN1778_c1_g1~~TRINITY_DN1778_c1_g1_i1.p1  ORF type:complete len:394 (+),score=38.10 TRINITY_DN1778_c1_g1_i1:56-1183(+)